MDKFKVWIKTECPFCEKTQALLLEKKLTHEIIIVDKKEEVLAEVQQKYQWSTVPLILKDDNCTQEFIGGYTELMEHLERNDS